MSTRGRKRISVKWTTPEGVTITSPADCPRLEDAFRYAAALRGWPVAAEVWVEADGVRLGHRKSPRLVGS